MSGSCTRLAQTIGVLACFLAACAVAQAQKVYRYVDSDGRIVYSDHAPPPSATNVQVKKLSQNLIETDPPIGTRIAQERFPVTLYTFACGDLCQRGEALLNRRGVPFTTVNVSQQPGADQLKRLTGEMQAPVLQVGDKMIGKGFNESAWQQLLTEAGYPKTPPPRRSQPAAKAEPPKAEIKPAAPPPVVSGGGYPK
jgi:glutaredoxin